MATKLLISFLFAEDTVVVLLDEDWLRSEGQVVHLSIQILPLLRKNKTSTPTRSIPLRRPIHQYLANSLTRNLSLTQTLGRHLIGIRKVHCPKIESYLTRLVEMAIRSSILVVYKQNINHQFFFLFLAQIFGELCHPGVVGGLPYEELDGRKDGRNVPVIRQACQHLQEEENAVDAIIVVVVIFVIVIYRCLLRCRVKVSRRIS